MSHNFNVTEEKRWNGWDFFEEKEEDEVVELIFDVWGTYDMAQYNSMIGLNY